MTQKVFHGDITPEDLADALVGEFSNDEFNANQNGDGDKIVVQIFKPQWRQSGGNTSLGISIQQHEDGVLVDMGDQEFLGVIASLGQTAFSLFQNPLNILGRLDDIASDVNSMQLPQKVWDSIERFSKVVGATKQISERLSSTACPYCNAANKVGATSCVQCGAPLGDVQPTACGECGFVNAKNAKFCSNCGKAL